MMQVDIEKKAGLLSGGRKPEASSVQLEMAELRVPRASLIAPHSTGPRHKPQVEGRKPRADSESRLGAGCDCGSKPGFLPVPKFSSNQIPPLRCARVVGLRLKVQRGRAPASGGRLDDHSPHPRRVLRAGSRADSPPRMWCGRLETTGRRRSGRRLVDEASRVTRIIMSLIKFTQVATSSQFKLPRACHEIASVAIDGKPGGSVL